LPGNAKATFLARKSGLKSGSFVHEGTFKPSQVPNTRSFVIADSNAPDRDHWVAKLALDGQLFLEHIQANDD
jgi:hypothetical protein